ncbi:hypothetical protein CVT25_006231 [Psilocybe cyanescens]|uniref:Uncharacterized protein n=1 Tax=Psilocybe cyanescens TaxID=93625 RepID=A0A409XKL4_PSICY|nr:hypothetical protein CVT25_006231 [Psilocybe cyanescens]
MAVGLYIQRDKRPESKFRRSAEVDDQKDAEAQSGLPYMHPSSNGSKAAIAIPTEIWTKIFHWSLYFHSAGESSAEPHSYPYPSPSLSHNPLIITQVCQYWREIVFKDATFWTRIYIRVRSKSSEYASQVMLLQEWIDRSKDLPLSLTVVGEREEPLADEKVPTPIEICDFVKRNHTRWHTLDITFSPIISRQYHTDILPLGDFPELQSLTLRAAEIGRNRYRPPRVTITAPKLSQMRVVGSMYVGGTSRSLPADSQHRDSSPYLTTKKAIIHEQHVIGFMRSFSKDEQNLHGGESDEVAVEEIYYTNECEPATNPASFEHLQITLSNLTSFTAKFGAPSNCTSLLSHMQCSSLTTLDLVVGGQGPPSLVDIGDFITRNGGYLQVLRLSAVDVHEGEMLDVLGTHGRNLKELHLVHIEGARPTGSFISNETFTRLTLPTPTVDAHAGDVYRKCILPNLSKFSYIGHTKDLTLSCIWEMLESRTTTLLSRGNEGRTANGVVMDGFILKSKDCFSAEDPKVVKSLQGLLDEGHTDLHIEASGKPIVPSNRS